MRILVTGGAGFIGSALVRRLIRDTDHEVLVFDKLTYAGLLSSLEPASTSNRYGFVQADICDPAAVAAALADFKPDVIAHLAAESHVDRSIDGPGEFVQTNVVGTFNMLQQALGYWRGLNDAEKAAFRFHHISTDEVFGDLPLDSGSFDEDSPYRPSSPYAASKAAADHLVRAWARSYDLPVLLTNCSNNYGPFQHPEKLIPLTITRALRGEPVPVYGDGENVRDWIHVEDHARALDLVLRQGAPGRTYAIGARGEQRNIAVVTMICDLLDARVPRAGMRRRDLIRYVADRRGHDRRYAIDPSRIEAELEWRPARSFEEGLATTVDWFVAQEGAA
eukprot:gene35332-47483_t